MSQQNLANPARPAVQKQRFNIYTMMLLLSFIAIVIACVLLYLELARFGPAPWWKTTEARVAPVSWVAPSLELPNSARRDIG